MKTQVFTLLFLCLCHAINAQINIIENGNTGIKTESPEHELDITGTTRSSERFEGTYTNNAPTLQEFQRILFPEGATLYENPGNSGGVSTGAIKIILPQDWSNTMMKFSVEVFSYELEESFSLHLAGYAYAGNSALNNAGWRKTSAAMTGGERHAQIPVRFGHDGNRPCVTIGNTNTDWAYLNVTISEFYMKLLYNSQSIEDWTKGWDMALINSLPIQIDREHFVSNAYQNMHAFNDPQQETAKFFLYPGLHNYNTTKTLGQLHFMNNNTFSFKVTITGNMGQIVYLFMGQNALITKNIIESTPKSLNFRLDEVLDVDIEYVPAQGVATIQIANNSTTADNAHESVVIECFSRMAAPYFTPLPESTPITPVAYNIVQNSAQGKWKSAHNFNVNELDATISRNGSVFINDAASSFIIRDQLNGSCYRIISENGVLSAQVTSCPQ